MISELGELTYHIEGLSKKGRVIRFLTASKQREDLREARLRLEGVTKEFLVSYYRSYHLLKLIS